MPQRELERLKAVNRFLKLSISKEQELQEITETAAQICSTPVAMITFMDEEKQHIKFKVGTDIEEMPYHNTFCQHTIKQDGVLVVPNATQDQRFADHFLVTRDPNVRFYAGAPLTTQDGHNMGTLCVFDISAKALSPLQQKMLQSLSQQAIHLMEFDASLQILKEQYISSRQEEMKLRSFFESSSSCHLLLDTEMRVISFNKALTEAMTTEHTRPFAAGLPITECLPADFISEFVHYYNKALGGEHMETESMTNGTEGRCCWYVTYEPAFNADGDIIGVAYNATDITLQVQHEEVIQLQNESLRHIHDIQTHSLNIPINSILSSMNSISKKGYHDEIIELSLLQHAVAELEEKSKQFVHDDIKMVYTDSVPEA